MPKAPKFQSQLNRGKTSSTDCGPRSWQMGIDAQTHGDKRPAPDETRKRAGCGDGTTSIYDADKAVETYTPKGRKDLKYYIKSKLDDVKEAVKNGKGVHVCVDYGEFNKRSPKTGDPNFKGGHSMYVLGQRKKTGNDGETKVQWHLYDPLMDGRRSGIAQGPAWIERKHITKSMEAFAGGKGKCYAGVFGGGAKKS